MTRICPTGKGPIHRRSDRAIYCSDACKNASNNVVKAARRSRPSDQAGVSATLV